jgi:Reverse transcriptase (RNA-dependent DNA polymerase)
MYRISSCVLEKFLGEPFCIHIVRNLRRKYRHKLSQEKFMRIFTDIRMKFLSIVTGLRIWFLYAALIDIQGAYINAMCNDNVYIKCGPEFGSKQIGKIELIVKVLYGLKTSAFAWREHLSATLQQSLEFTACYTDADVWMRPAVKADGTEYYEFVFVHTDDLLVVSSNPNEGLMRLDQHYVLKPGSIGRPTQYLGAEIGEYRLPDDPTKVRWYASSDKYVKEALRNVTKQAKFIYLYTNIK